ncbi:alpha/beta hydrolase [Acidovorax sp. Leaf76]|uniref:alpha/beta fold hydrolase n=1 Tax=unclassified Acidovorax TaxID=2684926 RepID=UPI0006F40501|nr:MULTISPECIES: alpha/beta hydrolase [unclassified Acidovorax]RZJ61432.1 MAG: alpha/beta hydrolase [Acidovorax sp.]KQO15868.1 alpha/beta hydrolase [Acidovorax sp. Leaf78]KQO24153.1 alpha/beta hydrolase [Acidovorax sp. Leaf76]KQO37077.1 alpha/beta hydrolase [Acidovorax sp. Leaf84]KQS29249.1 alpha/beta hydrolase [Acidovorax sp. Leaf191]
MYTPLKPSRSSTLPLRHLTYHVRHWGPEHSPLPTLVLLHGWMDVGASYQFTVDALQQERRIIAPDWRGFGLTSTAQADHYFFADYLADLDMLLDHYAPGEAIDLVGHSMGGNIAMMYAGVRPERIRRLVNLEGFGMPASKPEQAPKRYAQWIDELKQLRSGELALKTYDSQDGVARRLMKTNPRLSEDKARWLAGHWARPNAQGQWEILGDPAHKITSAQLYRLDEALALYDRIAAPVLAVEASDDSLGQWWKGRYSLEEYHQRLTHVRDVRTAVVQDAGHMLHHDQPGQVAQLIETFLAAA